MTSAVVEIAAKDAPKLATNGSQNGNTDPLAEINRKLDLLTQSMVSINERIEWLAERAEMQRRRQQEIDELFTDLTPVMHEMYDAAVEQMSGLEQYVQSEDLQMLLRRLARNTRNFNELLDLMESGFELVHDASPLTKEMVGHVTGALDELERKGYVGFMRQGGYVLDQIVTSFSEDDVRQLGDNVVLILNTVKALTQPEMMTLLSSVTQGFHEAEAHADELPTSLFGLVRQMGNPDVRRGLAITLDMLKRVSFQAPRLSAKP